MSGEHPTGGHVAREPRSVSVRFLLLIALLPCLPGSGTTASAQTPAPSESTPSAQFSEPALPTDPTAPSTAGPATAPFNPLTPSQPLSPLGAPPIPVTPAAPSAAAPLPDTVRPGGPGSPTATPAPGSAEAAATTNNIGTARRFQYAIALTLGSTFDDNIFLEPVGTERSDLYFTIQPSLSLGFGGGSGGTGADNLIRFRYSPQALLYVSHPELDTVQHFVDLSGVYHFAHLTLTGSLNVQILDSTDVGNPHPFGTTTGTGINDGTSGTTVNNAPSSNVNLDVGQRTRLNIYAAALAANYYVSDKVSYDLSGQFTINDYAGNLLSSRTLSGSGFFNYAVTAKTTLGLGVTAGYVFADKPNPNQSFEQGNLRVSYLPSSKLVMSGQVGLELRQAGDDDESQVTPIFNLSVSYSPFDGTAISLAGDRQTQTSAVLGGQDFRTTSFTVGVSQRFFQRFYLRLNVGYSHSDYVSQVAKVSADRTDDYYFAQPSLDWNLRDNIVAGFYYTHRDSTSSLNTRNYTDDQVGAHLSVSF